MSTQRHCLVPSVHKWKLLFKSCFYGEMDLVSNSHCLVEVRVVHNAQRVSIPLWHAMGNQSVRWDQTVACCWKTQLLASLLNCCIWPSILMHKWKRCFDQSRCVVCRACWCSCESVGQWFQGSLQHYKPYLLLSRLRNHIQQFYE